MMEKEFLVPMQLELELELDASHEQTNSCRVYSFSEAFARLQEKNVSVAKDLQDLYVRDRVESLIARYK